MTDTEILNIRVGDVIVNEKGEKDIVLKVPEHRAKLPKSGNSDVYAFFCDIYEANTKVQQFGIKYLRRDRTFKL